MKKNGEIAQRVSYLPEQGRDFLYPQSLFLITCPGEELPAFGWRIKQQGNRLVQSLGFIAVILWFLGLESCGYQLVGTGSNLAPTARTIAIPLLENRSREPGIEQEITRAIRNSFLTDGRLQLVTRSTADLLLLGVVSSYALFPLSFNRDDFIVEYRLEVEVEITLISQDNQQVLLHERINPARDDYLVSADIPSSEVARRLVLQNAFQKLGEQVVSLVVDGF